MDRRGDAEGDSVLPIIVHGDAAFAGQGVVMETLALAETRGYSTGGTVHIVINNQIGFTTSDPRDSRSTLYCSDVVKMIEAPVLHVNGDDPEAVVLCTQLALEYRQEFNMDVVDIICFRKLGHNEQDTPALTQPLMYKKIAAHPGTRRLYADKLGAQGMLPADGSATRWLRRRAPPSTRAATPSTRCCPTSRASTPSTGRPSSARSGPTTPTPPSRWRNGSGWPSASPPCRPTSPCTRW